MSSDQTTVVIGSIVLTDAERVLLAEALATEWQSQLDALDSAMNADPEGFDPDNLDAMALRRRMGVLHQLRKKILA